MARGQQQNTQRKGKLAQIWQKTKGNWGTVETSGKLHTDLGKLKQETNAYQIKTESNITEEHLNSQQQRQRLLQHNIREYEGC